MHRRPPGPTGRRYTILLITGLWLTALGTPAAAQSLSGRVVDTEHRPVARAQVFVLQGRVLVGAVPTGEDGRFGPLPLSEGDYHLLVSAPGLRAAPRTVSVGRDGVVTEIVVAPAAVTESLVISAASIDAPLSRVTDSVTVVERAELDARQIASAADAVRLVPGFGVVSAGGPGAITSLFPRGGESDYTLVLADGIPLNSFGGGFDAAHASTADLDRVEIVRGPQSALFGGGAIGGVVHLVSRHGGPTLVSASAESGSARISTLSASASGTTSRWTWSAAADRQASGGDRRSYPELGGRIDNDDYSRWNASAGLGWSGSPDRRVRVDVRHGRNERGFPGPYGSDPAGLFAGPDRVSRGTNRATGLSATLSLGDVTSLRHRAHVTWADATSGYLSPFGESEDETRRTTGRYQIDLERAIGGISAGLEYLRERADNTFITGQTFQPVPVRRSVASAFVETRWSLGARGSVTAGARLDRIARLALEGDPSPFGPRPAFDDDVVWSVNPKVSAVVHLGGSDAIAAGRWTRLRIGAGTGIKPPTAFEIAFTDNPSLRPERSRSLDIGIEQAAAGASVLVDATWFVNRYDDLIVAVGSAFSGLSRYRTDNIANALARGLELGLSWRGPVGLRVRGAWTFLHSEVRGVDARPDQAPPPFDVGDALVRRAPRQGVLEAHWATTQASAFVEVNGRSGMRDLEPNYAGAVYDHPGHVVLTAGGAVRLTRSLEVFGRITNLLDRVYEDVLGYPAPGRMAFLGLRVAAGR